MESSQKISFNKLKSHIIDAIKESCYRFDGRLYNVANQINKIQVSRVEAGFDTMQDLSKIIDKTIKDSVVMGCDLSVIIKGIFLGAFRSSPFKPKEEQKIIHALVAEILPPIFKYKGDVKQTIEGLFAAVVIISYEYNLNAQETLVVTKEEVLLSAKGINPAFTDHIKEVLPKSDDSS